MSTTALVQLADQYRSAAGGLPETTLSYRIFGDSKKLSALRGSADITVGRFNAAMRWMADHWPEGQERPAALLRYVPPPAPPEPSNEDAA